MQPPCGRLRRYSTATLICAALAAGSFPTSSTAGETERSANEALIGTFRVEGRAAPAQSNPRAFIKAGNPAEPSADALYEQATKELSAGRRAEAQRLFEQIVGRFPDDAMAAQSRRQLALIYLDDLQAAAARRSMPPPGPAVESGEVPATSWQTEVSRTQPGLDDFAIQAGDRVFFSTGSAELGGRGRSVVEAQARWLRSRPDVVAVVEGHADDPASDADNVKLSQDRAEAVRRLLVAEGIEAERVVVEAFGRRQRVSECADPDCAARNRRAVTIVRYGDEPPRSGANGAYPAAQLQRTHGTQQGELPRATR